jgi:protein import protein ZIM17
VFSDKSVTIEDLMREKGSMVKKGLLSAEGDVEFWDDGSTTARSAQFHAESKPKGDDRFTEQPKSPQD